MTSFEDNVHPAGSPDGLQKRTNIFWRRIQNEIGDVAAHIQGIINFQDLAGNKALALITLDDIMLIEDQMRNAVSRIMQRVQTNACLTMANFYGSFADKPENFKLSVGDIRVMQTIVNAVKENGIKKFIELESLHTSSKGNSTAHPIGSQEEWKALKTRIMFHYSNSPPDDLRFNNFKHSVDSTIAKFEQGAGGKIIAKLPCGICGRQLKLVRDPPRSWPVFNLIRHYDGHLKSERSGEEKRSKRNNETSSNSTECDFQGVSRNPVHIHSEADNIGIPTDRIDNFQIIVLDGNIEGNIDAETSAEINAETRTKINAVSAKQEANGHSMLDPLNVKSDSDEENASSIVRLHIEVADEIINEAEPITDYEDPEIWCPFDCEDVDILQNEPNNSLVVDSDISYPTITEINAETSAETNVETSDKINTVLANHDTNGHSMLDPPKESEPGEGKSSSIFRLHVEVAAEPPTDHEELYENYSSVNFEDVEVLQDEPNDLLVVDSDTSCSSTIAETNTGSAKPDADNLSILDPLMVESEPEEATSSFIVRLHVEVADEITNEAEPQTEEVPGNFPFDCEDVENLRDVAIGSDTSCPSTSLSIECDSMTGLMNDSVLLDILMKMNIKLRETNLHSRRYTELEKDVCSFEYLTAGNAHYQYVSSNMVTMSKKTIQRHMQKITCHISEGIPDVSGLKQYLQENGYPLVVALSEDGTRISATAEYDYASDSLRGLVAPLDSNGLPVQNMFSATTPYKIANYLKSHPVGNYAYVQIAMPLVSDAAPYVLYHVCSNNQFTSVDVINRWAYTEKLLQQEGIRVISHASDGDPRLLKAMKQRAGFDRPHVPSPWGHWFRVADQANTPINIQDMVHTINKFRNRLLKSDMQIGNFVISKDHLMDLVNKYSKDKHGLCMSDIDLKDKMKFGPTMKLINPAMIQFLEENIPNSKGTAIFLDLMHRMYRSFISTDVPDLERVHDIWTTNFVIRAWRKWCKLNHKNLAQCITTNSYLCLELNAHAIILLIKECQGSGFPEQFLLSRLSSQPCEQLFRELRSMATTNQTVVNFSIKELTEKLKRIYMKRHIMYKHREIINFPFIERLQRRSNGASSLPSDEQLIEVVENAQLSAKQILRSLGMSNSEIDMGDSIHVEINVQETEFVDVGEAECDSTNEGDERLIDNSSNVHFNDMENLDLENIENDSNMLDLTQRSEEPIYEAATIFENFNADLNLKNSRMGNKHTFQIMDSKGEIKNIKKSTLVWMLTEGRHRISTDRLRRFQQNECRRPTNRPRFG